MWSTVLGVYADAQGMEFRKKYAAKHPGVIGLCYNGSAYDTDVHPAQCMDEHRSRTTSRHGATTSARIPIAASTARCRLDNEYQAALHYPLQTEDLNKGMAQLYFQVQDGQHKIIQPDVLAESKFRTFPWA